MSRGIQGPAICAVENALVRLVHRMIPSDRVENLANLVKDAVNGRLDVYTIDKIKQLGQEEGDTIDKSKSLRYVKLPEKGYIIAEISELGNVKLPEVRGKDNIFRGNDRHVVAIIVGVINLFNGIIPTANLGTTDSKGATPAIEQAPSTKESTTNPGNQAKVSIVHLSTQDAGESIYIRVMNQLGLKASYSYENGYTTVKISDPKGNSQKLLQQV